MAEPLLLALLPIANDRMRGAALKKEYEDTLRRRYDLRTCARPWHAQIDKATVIPCSFSALRCRWAALRYRPAQ